MESLNVKNINDEKIFNVIDPNGQGEVVNRIRPISISINQKAETINDETDSTVNLSVYWNDTWKSILDLTFNDSLRQEYGKLVTDLTAIQKDIDMKQYKDAETKTSDFLKYVANLSSKYTAIPETQNVAASKNKFITIKAERNSVKATISDKLLNFMLKKFAKVNDLDYTKANECYRINRNSCIANDIALYFHSPELFQKQAYMTVVKDNKVVGSYKATYDQFCKLASKFDVSPQKLGYSRDKIAGYIKTAEVVMQNIFFDSVDEAKEWQEMVDEKKKEQAEPTPEGEETETTETTETKVTMEEGKSESPAKEEGGLARPSEDFASDEIPESEPRQQEQQQGGQMAASRRLNLLKKRALRKKAEEKKTYNVIIKFNDKEEEYQFKNDNEILALEEALGYFGEKWHELPMAQDLEKLEEIKVQELDEKGNLVGKEFTKEYFVKNKDKFPKYASTNKKAEEFKDITVSTGNVYTIFNSYTKANGENVCVIQPKTINGKPATEPTFKLECKPEEVKEVIEKWKDPGYMYEKSSKAKKLNKKAIDVTEIEENYKENGMNIKYKNLVIKDNSFVQEELKQSPRINVEFVVYGNNIYNGMVEAIVTCRVKPSKANAKFPKIERYTISYDVALDDETKKQLDSLLYNLSNKKIEDYCEYNDKGFLVYKYQKAACTNKQAIEGDVQEQDIVPAKTETKVYLQSSDKDLDKVWGIKMFVDNMDNKDGMDVVEFTKIGLIDHINELIEEHDSEHDYGNEKLDYNCSDDLLKEYVTNYLNGTVEFIKEAKNNPNVQKKAEEQTVEEKIEEQVADDTVEGKIGVGDIVTICIDKLEYPEEAFKYTELIGEPLILMDNDKEDINKVIVEQTEYPYQRMTVNKDDIVLYDEVKGEQVIVEDIDGDEMITDFVELPVVAKSCKIKAIRKAAKIGGK